MAVAKDKERAKKCVRNRSGCLICKKRKKKCGEEKPSCSSCVRLKLSCTYAKVLLWHRSNQQTVANIHARFTKHSQYHFLSSTIDDVVLSSLSLQDEQYFITSKSNKDHQMLSSSNDEPFLNFSSNSGVENDLFEYYISNLSKRRAFSDSMHNEFRSLIIPNCYISPLLFQSVIALLANDMVRTKPELSSYYSSLSSKYKNEAINILHNLLDKDPHFVSNEGSQQLNEMIITLLMLCSLEISDKGNKYWLNHLREGGMIFGSLTYSKILSSGMLLFAYRYFTLRYILLLTTLNDVEFEKFKEGCSWPLIDKYFDNEKIDYMLGCSPRLLFVIYKVTLLRHNRKFMKQDQFLSKFREIQLELSTLKQVFSSADQYSESLYLCSKLYYESTHIFLHSSLNPGCGDELIYDSLNKVISTLSEFCHPSGDKPLSLAPLWALFIACTCSGSLMNDQVRISLLDVFEKLERFWPKLSLYLIKLAVETIWKVNDLVPNDESSKLDKHTKADWRDILSAARFKLALT